MYIPSETAAPPSTTLLTAILFSSCYYALRNYLLFLLQMTEEKRRDSKGKKGKKRKGGFSTFFIGVVCSLIIVPLLGYGGYQLHLHLVVLPGLVNTPSELPRVTQRNAFSPELDPDLYWGSYAANLYFGLKTRSTNAPQFGIAWFEQPRQHIYMPKIRWAFRHILPDNVSVYNPCCWCWCFISWISRKCRDSNSHYLDLWCGTGHIVCST